MPWPDAIPRPTVTIVMPLERHRGVLMRAIDGWSSQDYPRELLDIVLVSNTSDPQIVAQVAERLAHPNSVRGGVVSIRATNEMAQYSYGARYARGEWLLFTESHCVPQLDCVSELIGTLLARGLAGGCVRTLSDHSTNPYAQIEERVYQDDFPLWSHDGDWRKFTKRGFALRRDVYRSIGGLEDEYGWFSELIISARLAADGHRVGYVPTAAVQHFNSTTIDELLSYVWDYHRELARYVDVGSPALKPYLRGLAACDAPWPPAVQRATRSAVRAVLAGSICRWHTLGGLRLACAMIGAQFDAAWGRSWKLAARAGLARLRMRWLSFNAEQRYLLYLAVAAHFAQWGLASYTPRSAAPSCAGDFGEHALEIYPGESAAGLYGFHVSERYAGRAFCWSSPVAAVMLEAAPADYELTLDAGGIVGASEELHVFCNGQKLNRGDGLSYIVRRETMVDAGPQVLTLIAPPRWTRDPRETRALGLPLFELRMAKLGRAKLRIAA